MTDRTGELMKKEFYRCEHVIGPGRVLTAGKWNELLKGDMRESRPGEEGTVLLCLHCLRRARSRQLELDPK